jgi:ribonuclease Y
VVLELVLLVVVLGLAVLYLIDRRSASHLRQPGPEPAHRARPGAESAARSAPQGTIDAPVQPSAAAERPAASAAHVGPQGPRAVTLDAGAPGSAARTSAATASPEVGSPAGGASEPAAAAAAETQLTKTQAEAAAAAAHRRVDAEAAAIIDLAKREAQALRRTAQSEADALFRAAALDSEAAAARAQRIRDEAESAAAAVRADAERAAATRADEEVARLTEQLRGDERDLRDQERDLLQAREQLERRQRELAEEERSITLGQAQLRDEAQRLEQLRARLEQDEAQLRERAADLQEQEAALAQAQDEAARAARTELERVAALTAADARQEVLRAAESEARREVAIMVRDLEASARAEADERARRIVAESVQRVASEQTVETVVSVMHLPSEEMKGRIIGREGRNIRSFEAVTGVNVIIDDTPEAVLLSCFDPVRREVGRVTLETLLADGRIHPHRIEEVYERSKAQVEELCLRAAQDALLELHIDDLDPRLLPVLGRLKYRTSYGQNVLAHSLESAHVAGVIAAEMGLEPALLQRCAFLHDIGKALTHEVEGSHAIVGAALLRKHGESEAVAHAVEAHHNEVQPTTIEAVLTQAADACSAARPGARRESIESYVKRLQRIEQIASAREGVDKVFAMQAGREVRVMVSPDAIDDLEAGVIAREIAKQIEDELTYPGQIRVTVVRESRAIEIAH